MIYCKIINKTKTPLALNWIPGGISIPVGSAAILEYDPFTLLDKRGSVYSGAMAMLDNGLIEVQYCAMPPAKTIPSLTSQAEVKEEAPRKVEPPKQRKSVFETDEEKGSALDLEVSVAAAKPAEKNTDEGVAVSVPKDAPKTEAPAESVADEAVAEAPAEEAPKRKRGSKKI